MPAGCIVEFQRKENGADLAVQPRCFVSLVGASLQCPALYPANFGWLGFDTLHALLKIQWFALL